MSASNNEDLFNELLELFAAEASDHLRDLNRKVLELEKTETGRRGPLIVEILRHAHTLKGAAAAVGLDEIGTLMHHLEGVFERVREGLLPAEPSTLDVAYQTLDAVAELAGLSSGEDRADVDLPRLTSALEALSQQDDGPPPPPRAANTADVPIAEPSTQLTTARTDETIRITTSKLDSIMAQVGELLVASSGSQQNVDALRELAESLARWSQEWQSLRSGYRDLTGEIDDLESGTASAQRWKEIVNDVHDLLEHGETRIKNEEARVLDVLRALKAESRVLAQSVNGLQDEVRRARMLPLATIFESLPRMIRDIAREQRKSVRLDIDGSDTEVDRSVLEQLKAPLNHLLRNCVDHGLEAPAARLAAGKQEEGTITLRARQQGSRVLIEVEDDGAGIDTEAVVAKAVDGGLVAPEEASTLGEREALQLIFRAGLSTSPILTDISGRGVGLDVVRASVEQLNGSVSVKSELGLGTEFSLTLPLTVVSTKCLIVRVADRKLALPISGITRTVRVHLDRVESVNGHEAISVGGDPIRLARLADVFGSAPGTSAGTQFPALVTEGTAGKVALAAD